MAYYAITNKDGELRGYVTSKEEIKLFKRNRNLDYYFIDKVTDKNIKKKLKLTDLKMDRYGNLMMFPYESESFNASFDQTIMDMRQNLVYMLKEIQFINFKENDKEVVEKYIQSFYQHLISYKQALDMEEELDQYDSSFKYFHVEDMAKDILMLHEEEM